MYQDMSFKEISESTGVSTALGRMRYAFMNLRKVIDNILFHQLTISVAAEK
jgi:RNA polymerase sigma-70 factor (ECF subfamily)